jgi:hypothetical protein
MRKSRLRYKEKINDLKHIFDKYNVKRLNVEDEFFMELINSIENNETDEASFSSAQNVKVEPKRDIKEVKMELMVNVEGLITNLKGQTVGERLSFGLDARKKGLSVFLTQVKLFMREKPINKHDVYVFYDDTALKTGNKGFIITIDEIISNVSGLMKIHRFKEMENEPEYVEGYKQDVIRVYIDNTSYDIKISKKTRNKKVAGQIMRILYAYAQEVMNEK